MNEAPQDSTAPRRILSIDALRGLDMMMILGLREVVLALCLAFGLGGLHDALDAAPDPLHALDQIRRDLLLDSVHRLSDVPDIGRASAQKQGLMAHSK